MQVSEHSPTLLPITWAKQPWINWQELVLWKLVNILQQLNKYPQKFIYLFSYKVSRNILRDFNLITLIASRGIRVNAVNPGVIITDVHKKGGMSDDSYKAFLEHCKTTHAMERVGTVDEVAKTVAFLASDDSSFITGQTLAIDGGRSIMCPR